MFFFVFRYDFVHNFFPFKIRNCQCENKISKMTVECLFFLSFEPFELTNYRLYCECLATKWLVIISVWSYLFERNLFYSFHFISKTFFLWDKIFVIYYNGYCSALSKNDVIQMIQGVPVYIIWCVECSYRSKNWIKIKPYTVLDRRQEIQFGYLLHSVRKRVIFLNRQC